MPKARQKTLEQMLSTHKPKINGNHQLMARFPSPI